MLVLVGLPTTVVKVGMGNVSNDEVAIIMIDGEARKDDVGGKPFCAYIAAVTETGI